MAKAKYLVETSAVPAALGESTPKHCELFATTTSDGDHFTSAYIRKEFIHRWVLYYIRVAFEIDHHENVSDAVFHLTQSFKIRDVKTLGHALAALLQEHGRINNCRSMAKEAGRLAFGALRKFDLKFKSRAENHCGCKIGGKQMRLDFNAIFDDLRAFVESQGIVLDCDVNSYLGFSKGLLGRAGKILAGDGVPKTKAGKVAAEYVAKNKHVTCKECAPIGDLIIAIEQPKYLCLVHIDRDYAVLCRVTCKPNKELPSEASLRNQ